MKISFSAKNLLEYVAKLIPQSPVHFYHGLGDEIVPYENTQITYDFFLEGGAQEVSMTLYPASYGGHGEVASVALLAGLRQFSNIKYQFKSRFRWRYVHYCFRFRDIISYIKSNYFISISALGK